MADHTVNLVVRFLTQGAKMAYAARDQIREDYDLSLVVSEVAGLLDIITKNHITNPDQTAQLHLEHIDRLVSDLHTVDYGADCSQDPDGGNRYDL